MLTEINHYGVKRKNEEKDASAKVQQHAISFIESNIRTKETTHTIISLIISSSLT